jgi:hypothetical protein
MLAAFIVNLAEVGSSGNIMVLHTIWINQM